jgi:hypothetical protein
VAVAVAGRVPSRYRYGLSPSPPDTGTMVALSRV